MDFVEWIKAGLELPGKNKIGLAKALGRSPSVVTYILSGTRQIKADELAKIAEYLEVPAPTLEAPQDTEPQLLTVNIEGEVRAGYWASVSEQFEREAITIAKDPRLDASGLFALRIRGTSINRQASDGAIAVCLDIYKAPRTKPRHGDWVIVRQMRNGDVETTVKRYHEVDDSHIELWPDSTDPAYQEPIRVTRNAETDDQIKITAFVVDFIRPATQF